jgi:GNAT superfamily N-acetyltransferase
MVTGLGTRPEPGWPDTGPAGLAAPRARGRIRVRRAVTSDREALTQMFDRCAGRTRYQRFHGYVNAIPDRYLTEALSGTPFHYALVACPDGELADRGFTDRGFTDRDAGGAIVALASCRVVAEGAAELGILVEDRWQRHGTGGYLLRELVTHAYRGGIRVLKAQILSEQAWIITVLQRYGTCHRVRGGYGTLDVTLRLGPPVIIGPAGE